MGKKKPSLLFVEAINFELTYKCNLSCPHCLQHDLRRQGDMIWIDTDSAIRCLKEAKELGFTRSGVNFTGGEPFLRCSNLPELLHATKHLELGVRVNTNGWWGGKQDVTIGSKHFSSSNDIIKWLKRKKVALLALSFDGRYEMYPALLDSVLQVVKECEAQGMYYQLVHTRSSSTELSELWESVEQVTDLRFNYMIPVGMEMVDLGAASDREKLCTDSEMYC
jgi:MoaA/NifB/PqqE/SkfB family radical SAM enzyme